MGRYSVHQTFTSIVEADKKSEILGGKSLNNKADQKITGLYIVSESGCLRPGSGANKHISAGMEELGKHFSIQQLLLCKPYQVPASTAAPVAQAAPKPAPAPNMLKAFIKWPIQLIKNHTSFFSHYRRVKKIRPDFIYERSSYLNYNGLLIARLLRIPHFYEVNGINAFDHRKHFPAIWNKLAGWLEKTAYLSSTTGFYVGGINFQMGINKRAVVVQNGIEKEFAEQFSNKQLHVNGVLHVAFIGYLMDHHRIDVLYKAMHLLPDRQLYHLHLIGTGMDELKEHLPPDLPLTVHGLLNHTQIGNVMEHVHVGVIPYALDYYSNVKAFLYGAGKLAIIVPEARNFKNIFTPEEVIFIRNANEEDLAASLERLRQHPELVEAFGENIYRKVRQAFTWEQVFRNKAEIITGHLKKR